MPLGAIILGDVFAGRMRTAAGRIEEFPHGFTSFGHPVACAVGMEAIDISLNERLLDRIAADLKV